jgi:NTE family protein
MIRIPRFTHVSSAQSGSAAYSVVKNAPLSNETRQQEYSIKAFEEQWEDSDSVIILTFSGGGTRAAALAYSVMKELRDTITPHSEGNRTLLDEVTHISSVSGGSFTAAYYGLHGNGIFDDFEEAFLRRNVQHALIGRALHPFEWFNSTGRTEAAAEYYEQILFKGATFADMRAQAGPLIVINASDLACGVRFSFVQEYFNLLCSDLSSFPVSLAVAASSAVPILFNPVVVRNYPDCGSDVPEWLQKARKRTPENHEIALVVDGVETYFNREKRKYIHLVDGGLTDNLGLRAIYEVIELAGGAIEYTKKTGRNALRRIVLISVNASTDSELEMNMTSDEPSIEETVSALSDIQLHRYNASTIQLIQDTLRKWANQLSTPEKPVKGYFIRIGFRDIQESRLRRSFNQTPTSFSLTNEQIDSLLKVGGDLLRNNTEYGRLMADLESEDG